VAKEKHFPSKSTPGNLHPCLKKAAKNGWLSIAGEKPALLVSHTLPLAGGSQPLGHICS
jgi:hypothetical protein